MFIVVGRNIYARFLTYDQAEAFAIDAQRVDPTVKIEEVGNNKSVKIIDKLIERLRRRNNSLGDIA